MMKLTFATHPSALARWQTQWVIAILQAAHPGLACVERVISTRGDRTLDKALPGMGGRGLFTQELETELLNRQVQVAVHSRKDLPTESAPGLALAAVPLRTDARDTLISRDGSSLESLLPGSVVGTSSLRRAAQVLSIRPDLTVAPLRGNLDTRLRNVFDGQYDAIILAGSGLIRLGLDQCITQWLSTDVMLPAPGQGALAVQCCADDHQTLSLLSAIDDLSTRNALTAERRFLLDLGGGCTLPVAAFGQYSTDDDVQRTISLTGLVISPDGKRQIKVSGTGADPFDLGDRLAREAIAKGAGEILHLVSEK